jgi:hypothetical protein
MTFKSTSKVNDSTMKAQCCTEDGNCEEKELTCPNNGKIEAELNGKEATVKCSEPSAEGNGENQSSTSAASNEANTSSAASEATPASTQEAATPSQDASASSTNESGSAASASDGASATPATAPASEKSAANNEAVNRVVVDVNQKPAESQPRSFSNDVGCMSNSALFIAALVAFFGL